MEAGGVIRDNTRAAVDLAELGYAVMPLHSPSPTGCDCGRQDCASPAKHPRTRHGLRDATVSPEQIGEWWRMWPHANIGVATGPPSGIVVLDVDPRHEGDIAWAALVEEHAYEHHGPVSSTGGGGWHYWFRHPGSPIKSRSGDIASGIDVKADGGYVVAPGSVHATGAPYEWYAGFEPWSVKLPEIPMWLHLLMIKQSESQHGADPVPDIIRDGQRHDHLVSLAGSMRARNMGEKAIFKALLEENAEKCTPPMDATEVAKIAASAGSWAPGEARIVKFPTSKTAGGARESSRGKPYEPEPFTARELQSMELPEPRWAIEGVLPEGMALLAGKPKLGKSWLALGVLVDVAEGGIVMGGWPVEDGDALGLFLEDNRRRLKGRMKMLLAGEPWPERLHMETRWPRLDEGGLDALDAWLGVHPNARIVVIDTLAKFRPKGGGDKRGRGNAYEEDYAAMEGVQELALRHNICILLITHFNKSLAEDDIDKVTGSTGTTGVADTILLLKRPRGVRGQEDATLFITGRDVVEQEYAVAFDGKLGRWTVLGDAADAKTSREERELVIFLAKAARPVTKQDVAAGLSIKLETARQRLYRAGLSDAIEHLGNGFYQLYRSPTQDFVSSDTLGGAPVAPVAGEEAVAGVLQGATGETAATAHTGATEIVDLVSAKAQKSGNRQEWPATSPDPPDFPCPTCGEKQWTLRTGGRFMCSNCRPAIRAVTE